jgi:preprotein translocase subunit SecA
LKLLTDEQLRQKTAEFKERLSKVETDDILDFAVVRGSVSALHIDLTYTNAR